MNETPPPAVSTAYAALTCRCPRCGKGKVFRSFLEITDYCSHCNLPLKEHEQGDGPAFFAILLVGALTAISAAIVEVKFSPPFWVHAALWFPLVIIGSLASLRWLKAALVAVQYQYRRDDFNT